MRRFIIIQRSVRPKSQGVEVNISSNCSQFRGTGVMGSAGCGRVSPTCLVVDSVWESEWIGRVLSTLFRKQVRREGEKSYVESQPCLLHAIFVRNNTCIRTSRIVRGVLNNLPPRRFSSAKEYPGPNTNRSQECQPPNDTSNNGTHVRR